MFTNWYANRTTRILIITFTTVFLLISIAVPGQDSDASVAYTGTEPVIFGEDHFRENVMIALEYLENNDPDAYLSVIYWIDDIHPTDTYTRVNNFGTCYLNSNDFDANPIWLAGVLIHEAKHVEDDNSYFLRNAYSDRESEQRALSSQVKFLAVENSWTGNEADNWVSGWLEKRYWETIPAKYS